MIEPSIRLSLFKRRTKTAKVRETYVGTFFGTEDFAPASDHIYSLIEHSRKHKQEHYWSFASYKRTHSKIDIQEMTAVVLSFPYEVKAQLIARLQNFAYVSYLIHGQHETYTKRPEERLILAVVLERPITSPNDYTRIASLLADQIGIEGHSAGDFSATFLFAPFAQVCTEPSISLVIEDRVFLNADEFLASNKGIWTDARDYQATPIQTDETGLFQLGGAADA